MKFHYRIVLASEDGEYIIRDGFTSMRKAEYVAECLSKDYGEGQRLFVERYCPTTLW